MTDAERLPKRNGAAVLLVAAGAVILVAAVVNGTLRSMNHAPATAFSVDFGLLLVSFVLAPIAILVAFRLFGTGTQRLEALGGDCLVARLLFVLTALFTLAAQYSLLGPLLFDIGDSRAARQGFTVSYVLDGVAFVLALVTSLLVIRAGVVQGLARWALPVAALLVIVSVIVSNVSPTPWGDVPHGLAVLLLGVAYWRAGVPSEVPVPGTLESLAE